MEVSMEEKHVDPKAANTNLSIDHISGPDLLCLKSEDAPEILVTDLRSLPIVRRPDQSFRKN
jgi:hypothetical protein